MSYTIVLYLSNPWHWISKVIYSMLKFNNYLGPGNREGVTPTPKVAGYSLDLIYVDSDPFKQE